MSVEDPNLNDEKYRKLSDILCRAYEQAAEGKGHVRHGNENTWEEQTSMNIRCLVYEPFLFQATKKIVESQGLDKEAAQKELLGAINYCALQYEMLED